jgi:3-dehydroquinate synthase
MTINAQTLVSKDRWGEFKDFEFPQEALVLVDAKVKRLHSDVAAACRGQWTIPLRASEALKSLPALQYVAERSLGLSRQATVMAIGGGTVGDFAGVFAHLHKRGVRLVHVPSTLLAAVDSSVGGKAALNVATTKNALGVFHPAFESWICPELWTTLTEAQLREGRIEAFKTVLTSETHFRRWCQQQPNDVAIVKLARKLKNQIVSEDPFETTGRRAVLNFGHTLGHVIESVSNFRIPHGEAVGLGLLCALDVGVRLGHTPATLRALVESHIPQLPHARRRLAQALKKLSEKDLVRYVKHDKKGADERAVAMMLLRHPGTIAKASVPFEVLAKQLALWKDGRL